MRERPGLSGVPETLLVTLHAKALESRSADSILRDRFAAALVERIDYDFARLRVDTVTEVSLALRARYFDEQVRAFLADRPDAVVLNLGCGLDTRILRVDSAADVPWFDVDLPEVIGIRQRLYESRAGYRMIAASVTDGAWLAEVPAGRPTIVIAEGLLLYLQPADVEALLRRLLDHCGGGELAFDGYSRLGVRLLPLHPGIGATGARAHWGLDDPRALERSVRGLKLVEEIPVTALAGKHPMPALLRLWARAGLFFPPLWRLGRILRYRF
jgi:methyltransferase (TIGR00027 family)